MKKIIFVLFIQFFTVLCFAETIVCPHCGQEFDYNRSISTVNIDDYKVINVDTYNALYKNTKHINEKVCIKNLYILDFYNNGKVMLAENKTYNPLHVYTENEEITIALLNGKGKGDLTIFGKIIQKKGDFLIELDKIEIK